MEPRACRGQGSDPLWPRPLSPGLHPRPPSTRPKPADLGLVYDTFQPVLSRWPWKPDIMALTSQGKCGDLGSMGCAPLPQPHLRLQSSLGAGSGLGGSQTGLPRSLDQNIPHVQPQRLKRVALGLGSPELSWTPAHPARRGSGCGEVLGSRLGSSPFGGRPAAPSGLEGTGRIQPSHPDSPVWGMRLFSGKELVPRGHHKTT